MTSPGGTSTLHGGPPGAIAGPLPGYPQDTHSDVPVKVERITAASTGKSKCQWPNEEGSSVSRFVLVLFNRAVFFYYRKKKGTSR